MNRLSESIMQLNFRKIVASYIIFSVIALIGVAGSIGFVFRDSISFAGQYSKLNEAVQNMNEENIQTKADQLADSSSNLIDVLVLNGENEVLYSAKQSEFSSGKLSLSPLEDKNSYLTNNIDGNVVFKFVKGEKFLLTSVFDFSFEEIQKDYADESFYEENYSEKTLYMLTYLVSGNGEYKIYIISNPYTTEGGELVLSIAAAIGVLIIMIYWVLLALWVYQNSMRAKLKPFFWGTVVLITNIAGLLVYLMYKYGNNICHACGASQEKNHQFCTNCGSEIGNRCKDCGTHITKNDKYCSGCGKKIDM